MDYNALNMFVAVAYKGSLSAAAKHLHVPLPTLSRKIVELETHLKVQLLERTASGCRVTEAGARLFEQASIGIDMLHEAERAIAVNQARLIGHLRLSLPQSFGPWWDMLSMFQRAHPSIRVSVYSTERRVELLGDGIDVALRVGAIADDSVVARHLMTFRHVLVASPKLLAARSPLRTPSDIAEFPCAAWGSTIDARVVWNMGGAPFEVPVVFTVNDYLHLRSRAVAGDVVTELPSFIAADFLKSGDLVEILPEYPFPRSPLHLVYRRQRYPSTIIRTYLDFCIEHLSDVFEKYAIPLDEASASKG